MDKMTPSTKLEDKLEGIENFQPWTHRNGLILRENDIDKYIKDEVPELEEDESKERHWKELIKEMRIIIDSIKDNLIPEVSSNNTLNKMYYALSRMYEGRNINRKMNLRAQLKGTKMSKGDSIQEYFTRVSHFKENLSAIGETVNEDELVMTACNSLTRPRD